MAIYNDSYRKYASDRSDMTNQVYYKLLDIFLGVYDLYLNSSLSTRAYLLNTHTDNLVLEKEQLSDELYYGLKINRLDFITRFDILEVDVYFDIRLYEMETKDFLSNLDIARDKYMSSSANKKATLLYKFNKKKINTVNFDIWSYLCSVSLEGTSQMKFKNSPKKFIAYKYVDFMVLKDVIWWKMTSAIPVVYYTDYNKFRSSLEAGTVFRIDSDLVCDIQIKKKDFYIQDVLSILDANEYKLSSHYKRHLLFWGNLDNMEVGKEYVISNFHIVFNRDCKFVI